MEAQLDGQYQELFGNIINAKEKVLRANEALLADFRVLGDAFTLLITEIKALESFHKEHPSVAETPLEDGAREKYTPMIQDLDRRTSNVDQHLPGEFLRACNLTTELKEMTFLGQKINDPELAEVFKRNFGRN
jgi:hypothetical protein